jgi:hypothetical protein
MALAVGAYPGLQNGDGFMPVANPIRQSKLNYGQVSDQAQT